MLNFTYKKSVILVNLLLIFGVLSNCNADGSSYNFIRNSGLSSSANTAGYAIGTNATSINQIMSQVLFALLGLVAVIFFGLMLYGGIVWMTARDNADKVTKAKSIITNSMIGLIVTLSAYAISYFIFSYFAKFQINEPTIQALIPYSLFLV